tara:strand:+ start:18179 stop:20074 length:1896 start_codon:yes stop_codon:yes gene_type:complete
MLVYFDLEADGLIDEATVVHCGVFLEAATGIERVFLSHQVEEMLAYMDTCKFLVAHNAIGYDFPLLKILHGYEYRGFVVDTAIMSRLQDADRKAPFNCPVKNRPHSLQAWGYRVGRGKVDHEDWSTFTPEMLHRCEEDVRILKLVHEALKVEGGEQWREANKLAHKLFPILHEQEQYGWLIDQDQLNKNISLLSHWIKRIDKVVVPMLPMVLEIEEVKKEGEYNYVRKPFLKSGKPAAIVENSAIDPVLVGGQFSRISFRQVNLDSGQEVKAWLLREGWTPDKWNYKTDKAGRAIKDDKGRLIKTSPILNGDDSFKGVQGKVGKLIARRVQCRHRRSGLEGWQRNVRTDGRLAQRITGICTTGRLKHSGIVNVPNGDAFFGKMMRKCFVAKDGFKLVGVDADSCQLRMLAACMGDAKYQQTILTGNKAIGTDVHSVNKVMAGLNTRGQAKTFIYGFLFGGGDKLIGEIVGGGFKEGKAIKDKFLSKLPKLKALISQLEKEWKLTATKKESERFGGYEYSNGTVKGVDGRPIRVESDHKLLVFLLQNMEAVLMQQAIVILKEWLDAKGWVHGREYGFVGQAHDEWTAEVREDLASEYKRLAEQSIVVAAEHIGLSCPHSGEAEIGNNWLEIH